MDGQRKQKPVTRNFRLFTALLYMNVGLIGCDSATNSEAPLLSAGAYSANLTNDTRSDDTTYKWNIQKDTVEISFVGKALDPSCVTNQRKYRFEDKDDSLCLFGAAQQSLTTCYALDESQNLANPKCFKTRNRGKDKVDIFIGYYGPQYDLTGNVWLQIRKDP
jgi:hypothetical protein